VLAILDKHTDPEESQAEFENIVAHESHHIGFSDVNQQYEERIKSLPQNAQKAAEGMGAFSEGLAVLAATGSADVHPMHDFELGWYACRGRQVT
jgi:hypothetical protein